MENGQMSKFMLLCQYTILLCYVPFTIQQQTLLWYFIPCEAFSLWEVHFISVISQGYYLDEWLVCALNQVQFDTYVSDTYSFAYFLILRNGTSMSATNQHSSKWYPRLLMITIIAGFYYFLFLSSNGIYLGPLKYWIQYWMSRLSSFHYQYKLKWLGQTDYEDFIELRIASE